jgi:hypothetical protein
MRRKGITFDVVRREMRIIRDDLHCNAVRVTGGYPDRLKIAATHAADAASTRRSCTPSLATTSRIVTTRARTLTW